MIVASAAAAATRDVPPPPQDRHPDRHLDGLNFYDWTVGKSLVGDWNIVILIVI